jgi:polyphosphate kinase
MPLTAQDLFNRELSWLEFNHRVLAEATDPDNPLLERLKFLGIVSSNLDEFFMVRIPGLQDSPELLKEVYKKSYEILRIQNDFLEHTLIPSLDAAGVVRIFPQALSEKQREHLRRLCLEDFFPLFTPLALREEAPLPRLANLSIYVAFSLVRQEDQEKYFGAIELPRNLPRLISLPSDGPAAFIPLEDVIFHFAQYFFPGYEVEEWGTFRLTRAGELTLDEEKDEDFAKIMTEALRNRHESEIVRMECSLPENILEYFKRRLEIEQEHIICRISGWLDLKGISQLAFQGGLSNLKRPAWKPRRVPAFENTDNLWELLKEQDVLVHYPYESFETFNRFLREAAEDPDVLMIKQTLYRIAYPSSVISSLERAAENGKQVTVLVELKARFDEEKNIQWAEKLRRAGATVLYGIAGLKVHSKACLVVRREPEGIRRYLHLATGNYNEKTAQIYSDLGLFTSDEKLTADVAAFFNVITGYSLPIGLSKIEIAPYGLKKTLLRLILREALHSKRQEPGLIIAKMNSLVDPEVIEALYRASQAGVRIQLNIRGICCLKPGLKGLSETIEVRSIVDMFLEHSRIFYFHNGGGEEIYLSSADWMPRNLERRIELMFPVEKKSVKKELLDLLKLYFKDNVKAWRLLENGGYEKISAAAGEKRFRVQEYLCRRAEEKETVIQKASLKELKPQRPKP